MNEAHPFIDYANLPTPNEGIVVTTFITVRSVARSRAFYRDVLEGTVVLEENPCMVQLANSWIIINPGGPPTPDKPRTARHGSPSVQAEAPKTSPQGRKILAQGASPGKTSNPHLAPDGA